MFETDTKSTPFVIDEQEFPRSRATVDKLKFLLRYAVLAPSSYNTQPWKFSVSDQEIHVYCDKSRWLRIADPEQRELHINVGCALENFLIAAEHFEFGHQLAYFPEPEHEEYAVRVSIVTPRKSSAPRDPSLFSAIPKRCTNHKQYHRHKPPPEAVEKLRDCLVEEHVYLELTDDWDIKQKIDELVVHGDAVLFADRAYREELDYWIRKEGYGTPGLMGKIGQLAMAYMNVVEEQAKQDSEILISSPFLGVLSSKSDTRADRVKVGQIFERLWLTATNLGLSLHPMNQVVEVPEIRDELKNIMPGLREHPMIVFRMGYADEEDIRTPRRPLAEMLIKEI